MRKIYKEIVDSIYLFNLFFFLCIFLMHLFIFELFIYSFFFSSAKLKRHLEWKDVKWFCDIHIFLICMPKGDTKKKCWANLKFQWFKCLIAVNRIITQENRTNRIETIRCTHVFLFSTSVLFNNDTDLFVGTWLIRERFFFYSLLTHKKVSQTKQLDHYYSSYWCAAIKTVLLSISHCSK